MAKLVLKSGRLSVKEASSDPAVNEAYACKSEQSRLQGRKWRQEKTAREQGEQRLIAAKQVITNRPWPPYKLRKLSDARLAKLLISQEFQHVHNSNNTITSK